MVQWRSKITRALLDYFLLQEGPPLHINELARQLHLDSGNLTRKLKELEMEGVGFKGALKGNILTLTLGFSHPIDYQIPAGITIVLPKPTQITVSGNDKQMVGQVAAEIRLYHKPEPYKGKGIHYVGEHIRRKQGKTVG